MVKTQIVPAGEFKAKCLKLIDQVAETGRPIIVTKRGKPIAQLVPLEPIPAESLIGTVIIKGDLVAPLGVNWDADQ